MEAGLFRRCAHTSNPLQPSSLLVDQAFAPSGRRSRPIQSGNAKGKRRGSSVSWFEGKLRERGTKEKKKGKNRKYLVATSEELGKQLVYKNELSTSPNNALYNLILCKLSCFDRFYAIQQERVVATLAQLHK